MRAKLKGGPFDGKELETNTHKAQRMLIPVATDWTGVKVPVGPQPDAQPFVFVAVNGPFAEYTPESKRA